MSFSIYFTAEKEMLYITCNYNNSNLAKENSMSRKGMKIGIQESLSMIQNFRQFTQIPVMFLVPCK